jgi:hypothetical protein
MPGEICLSNSSHFPLMVISAVLTVALTSGLPQSTDIARPAGLVRFVPVTDIGLAGHPI